MAEPPIKILSQDHIVLRITYSCVAPQVHMVINHSQSDKSTMVAEFLFCSVSYDQLRARAKGFIKVGRTCSHVESSRYPGSRQEIDI